MSKKSLAILAALAVCVSFGIAHAYLGSPVVASSACHWEDDNGNNVGSLLTFVPPDSPESGGYCCRGSCIYMEKYGRQRLIEVECTPGPMYPLQPEENGVYAQECACGPLPPGW